jgi:hypothetical protein
MTTTAHGLFRATTEERKAYAVSDLWAAVHCNSIGIAPTTRGIA